MRWYCEYLDWLKRLEDQHKVQLTNVNSLMPVDQALTLCHLFDAHKIESVLLLGRPPGTFGLLRWAAAPHATVVAVGEPARLDTEALIGRALHWPYLLVAGNVDARALNDARVLGRCPYDLVVYDAGGDADTLRLVWDWTQEAGNVSEKGMLFLPWQNNRAKRDFADSLPNRHRNNFRHPRIKEIIPRGNRSLPGVIYVHKEDDEKIRSTATKARRKRAAAQDKVEVATES